MSASYPAPGAPHCLGPDVPEPEQTKCAHHVLVSTEDAENPFRGETHFRVSSEGEGGRSLTPTVPDPGIPHRQHVDPAKWDSEPIVKPNFAQRLLVKKFLFSLKTGRFENFVVEVFWGSSVACAQGLQGLFVRFEFKDLACRLNSKLHRCFYPPQPPNVHTVSSALSLSLHVTVVQMCVSRLQNFVRKAAPRGQGTCWSLQVLCSTSCKFRVSVFCSFVAFVLHAFVASHFQ